MATKGTVAFVLAMALAASPLSSALGAQQANGILGGKATDKAKQPDLNYQVRVRTTSSTAPVQTVTLDAQGAFRFLNLPPTQAYLVDLVQVNDNNKVVCTEGPDQLSQQMLSKTDINIDCGRNPTAWILAAGAGAAIIAAATQSSTE